MIDSMKTKLFSMLFVIIASITSMATTTHGVATITKSSIIPPDSLLPKYGYDSLECIDHLSIYSTSYDLWVKSGNNQYLVDFYPSWRYVVLNCPGSRINTFIRAKRIMEGMMEIAENETIKEKYIDTLLMTYDIRAKYFGRTGYVYTRKFYDMISYRPNDTLSLYKTAKIAVDSSGNKAEAAIIFYDLVNHLNMFNAGKISVEALLNRYVTSSEYCVENIKKGNIEYEETQEKMTTLMLQYVTCEQLIDIYTPKYEKDSTDIELCNNIVKFLKIKDCHDYPLYIRALQQLERLDPKPSTQAELGRYFFKMKNFNQSITYLNKAIRNFKETEIEDKIRYLLVLSDIYISQKQYSRARESAYDALALKENDPEIYLKLAEIYHNGAGTCGSSVTGQGAPYWAAYDKYAKAKSLTNDPVITAKAEDGMNKTRRGFPLKEDIFFDPNINPGDVINTGCWINETTTVRSRD